MNNLWQRLKRLVERQTMTSTIILGFLIVFIPLAVVIGWYGISETENSLEETAEATLTTLAVQVKSEVERVLLRSYQDVKTLADNPIIKSDVTTPEDKLSEMRKVQNFYRMFTDITLIDVDGNVITSTAYGYHGDWRGKSWFQEAVLGNVSVSPPHIVLNPRQFVMAYAAPVQSEGNDVTAVIVGQMNMTTIWEITNSAVLGKTGHAVIIDESGRYIAHPQNERLFTKLEQSEEVFLQASGNGDVELVECKNSEGDRILGASAALDVGPYTGGQDWYVMVCQSADEVFDVVDDTSKRVIIGVAGAFLLLIITIAILIHRTTKPIHILSAGVEKVGAGELTFRAPVSGTREVRRLASSFNDMVRNLQASESLRIEHGLLRRLQAAGTALAGALSPKEVLQIMTNGIRDILRSDVVWILLAGENNNFLETRMFVAPKKGQPSESKQRSIGPMSGERISLTNGGLLAKAYKDGKPLFLNNLALLKDLAKNDPLLKVMIIDLGMTNLNLVPLTLTDRNVGIIAFGRTSGKPLSDADKRIVLVFAHQATISLERVRLRAIELESTAELSRLSDLKSRLLHILSHELKTPLTSLRASSRLLQESDINTMDAQTQQRLIGNIYRATERLVSVADDIYPIAGAVTGSIKIERRNTDCRRIINSAVKAVSPLTTSKAQEVNVSIPASISSIFGDGDRLSQVLVNLLTNASSFSPQGSRIDITLHDEKTEIVFEISDQGIGISEQDQKSIFDGFYQADSEIVRRAGGKGLGLLFARTVVELHDGRIWVKSRPGEGSRFYFSIPKQE